MKQILSIELTESTTDKPINVREMIDYLKIYPQNLELYITKDGLNLHPLKVSDIQLENKS